MPCPRLASPTMVVTVRVTVVVCDVGMTAWNGNGCRVEEVVAFVFAFGEKGGVPFGMMVVVLLFGRRVVFVVVGVARHGSGIVVVIVGVGVVGTACTVCEFSSVMRP